MTEPPSILIPLETILSVFAGRVATIAPYAKHEPHYVGVTLEDAGLRLVVVPMRYVEFVQVAEDSL